MRFPRSNAPRYSKLSSVDITMPDHHPSTSSRPSTLRPSSSSVDPHDQAHTTGRGRMDRQPGSKLGLNAPFNHSTIHNPLSSWPTLRQLSTTNGPWDPETISPSRTSSSVGTIGWEQLVPRPSLDNAQPMFERFEQQDWTSAQSWSRTFPLLPTTATTTEQRHRTHTRLAH